MSDVAALSTESVKGLGGGAYLANVLPSMVVVLSVFALTTSGLYPGAETRTETGKPVEPGLPSVISAVSDLGIAGGVVLALLVLIVAVLLRPFQIATVQLIEGYWRRDGFVGLLAIERHSRRASLGAVRRRTRLIGPSQSDFASVAAHARALRKKNDLQRRADEIGEQYPHRQEWILPTRLGNLLRRAETTAGERYGLDTVTSYPRLYPHLSTRLDEQIVEQLNVIDVTATFVIVFLTEAAVSAPLLARGDGWSLVPLVSVGVAVLSYRGACSAAALYGRQLAAAYDLHRFDLLAAMRLPLPVDSASEQALNAKVNRLFSTSSGPREARRLSWTYVHPETPADP